MAHETALGAALKQAVQTLSKRQQRDMIAEHIYGKYAVFSTFKPLSSQVEQELVQALPQFDAALIGKVVYNHTRRPKYLKAVARGGKRFNLNNRFDGEVTAEEQAYALQQPNIKEMIDKENARRAEYIAKRKKSSEQQANSANSTEDKPIHESQTETENV